MRWASSGFVPDDFEGGLERQLPIGRNSSNERGRPYACRRRERSCGAWGLPLRAWTTCSYSWGQLLQDLISATTAFMAPAATPGDTFDINAVSATHAEADAPLQSIPNPNWKDVETAITRLAAVESGSVFLKAANGSTLSIGGDRGRGYLVFLSDATGHRYLQAPGSGRKGVVSLVIGFQPAEYPRRIVVDLNASLKAARAYFESGRIPANDDVQIGLVTAGCALAPPGSAAKYVLRAGSNSSVVFLTMRLEMTWSTANSVQRSRSVDRAYADRHGRLLLVQAGGDPLAHCAAFLGPVDSHATH
jgi:hypothetical protein